MDAAGAGAGAAAAAADDDDDDDDDDNDVMILLMMMMMNVTMMVIMMTMMMMARMMITIKELDYKRHSILSRHSNFRVGIVLSQEDLSRPCFQVKGSFKFKPVQKACG